MSYLTVEVEIENGHVVPREPAKLPEKGRGLLTVLEPHPDERTPGEVNPLEAFHALQKSLDLDQSKAKAWMEKIRDARR